jgi:hypothetical protein
LLCAVGIAGYVGPRRRHDRRQHVLRIVFAHESGKIVAVRIVATAVFERVVYQCACTDTADPAHPVLEVDAILRDGDADGPLLLPVASYKAMVGFDAASACMPAFRRAGRTEQHDGVEYLTFPLWRRVG